MWGCKFHHGIEPRNCIGYDDKLRIRPTTYTSKIPFYCLYQLEILKSVRYVNLYILEQTITTGAGVSVDKIDLHIMSLLNANCRTPYRSIASTVGISANAVKTRVKKMIAKGIIQQFVTVVNPTVLGYEKQCILTVRNIDNIIMKEEGHVFNQLNLLGDVWAYAKQLYSITLIR